MATRITANTPVNDLPRIVQPRIPVCLALPGAGTALGVIAGALEVLSTAMRFQTYGGTSGGALVALALAYGMTPRAISDLIARMLMRRDLLDPHVPIFEPRTGTFRGRKIEALLQDVFGEKTRMGELKAPCRVTVASMWTRRPAVVCSARHPEVPVWRAARAAMGIERLFSLTRLREDNARTYGDGGLLINVPAGIWDDRPEPTVVLRFVHQARAYTLPELLGNADGGDDHLDVEPVRDPLAVDLACFSMLLGAANASWPSTKPAARVLEVELDSRADGLDFSLDELELSNRRRSGLASGQRWLEALDV